MELARGLVHVLTVGRVACGIVVRRAQVYTVKHLGCKGAI